MVKKKHVRKLVSRMVTHLDVQTVTTKVFTKWLMMWCATSLLKTA